MPKEMIVIRLSSLPAHEAAAEFFSYVAFPDEPSATQRRKYRVALSRWAIVKRARLDSEWARTYREIRPSWFSQSEHVFQKSHNDGFALLMRRAVCAASMIMPYLGEQPQEIDDGLAPTVANISKRLVARVLGYSEGSSKTIESRLWAPTKPVAHAAAAFMLFKIVLDELKEPWDQEHELFNRNWFLGILSYADVIKVIVEQAEELRHRMLAFGTFTKLHEENTIQFILD